MKTIITIIGILLILSILIFVIWSCVDMQRPKKVIIKVNIGEVKVLDINNEDMVALLEDADAFGGDISSKDLLEIKQDLSKFKVAQIVYYVANDSEDVNIYNLRFDPLFSDEVYKSIVSYNRWGNTLKHEIEVKHHQQRVFYQNFLLRIDLISIEELLLKISNVNKIQIECQTSYETKFGFKKHDTLITTSEMV